MNRDDIIRMAKKAELHCHMNLTEHSLAIEDLEHFAALVRDDVFNKHTHLWLTRINEAVKAERESCAKLLEGGSFLHGQSTAKLLADEAAKAIRAKE